MKRRFLYIKQGLFFLWLAWLFLLPAPLGAQQLRYYHLSVSSGNNYVRNISQDSVGYLWLGTSAGLYRYDGYQMLSVAPLGEQQSVLMPDNNMLQMEPWHDSFLWLSLRGKLYSLFDTEHSHFVDFTGDGSMSDTYDNYSIVNDSTVWLYGARGCKQISFDGTSFHSMKLTVERKQLPSNVVRFVEGDGAGNTWIGTDRGIVCYKDGEVRTLNSNDDFVQAIKNINGRMYFTTTQGRMLKAVGQDLVVENTFALSPQLIRDFNKLVMVGDKIIITTKGATLEYDINTFELTPSSLITARNAQIVADNQGNPVVFDRDGLDVWYFVGKNMYHIRNIYSPQLTQQNAGGKFKFVHAKDGRIWISTYGNGLFSYNTSTRKLDHYLSGVRSDAPIRTDYLIELFEDRNGNIWVGEENYGVTCIVPDNHEGQYVYFTHADDLGHANFIRLLKRIGNRIYIGNMSNGLKVADANLGRLYDDAALGDDIIDVEQDAQGRLWIGTHKSGVIIDGVRYTHQEGNAASLTAGKISDIIFDRKGRAWLSFFNGGVDVAVREADGSYTFRHLFVGKHQVMNPRQMIVDHKGSIWLLSNEGVYTFSPDELLRDAADYEHIAIAAKNETTDECHCIFEDSRRQVWVGTTGHGLAQIDNTTDEKKVMLYTMADGLSDNNVESIVEDKSGSVWIGTDNGLTQYSPQNRTFRNHMMGVNTLSNIYTESCVAILANGKIAMGTRHGIVVFDPLTVKAKGATFNLVISNININGIPLREQLAEGEEPPAVALMDKIELNHNQNSLTFFFSDFEFSNVNRSRYTYFLQGYDKNWSALTTDNSAQYKNLPAGTYTMRVRSCSGSGEWNPHEVELKVIIRPPFWLSWWAYLIYIFTIGALGWYVYRNAKEKLRLNQQIEVETRLTEYKLRFFTNISHEFRTPLTLIKNSMDRIDSISEVPGNLRMPLGNMHRSVDRMTRLVNQLLEFRKMQNDKLHLALEETDVIAFVRDIYNIFRDVAENKNISYQFMPFESKHTMFIDKSFLDKIMYNLISNAFKYTPQNQTIVVEVKRQDDKILFVVSDTGMGVPKEKQGELFQRFMQSSYMHDSIGIGLHFTSELVHMHHGEISYGENPGGGSIFTVTLPDEGFVYAADDFLVQDNALPHEKRDGEEAGVRRAALLNYREMTPDPLNNYRVLIVEDDADIAAYMKEELQRYFVVVSAGNGKEAMELLKDEGKGGKAAYDLVISDVMMPVMNGFELTKLIRADKELADMPVILLTALTAEDKQMRGLNVGADAYIEKPFSMAMLIARATQLIEQRNRLRHAYAKEVVGKREAPVIITDEKDAKLRDQLDAWLTGHLGDPKLNIDDFAESMGYGRTTFYKKVKRLVGVTPNEYIKKLRMNRAVELLGDDTLTISQVAYQIGISDPYYFSKMFKSYFGVTPSKYRSGEPLAEVKEDAAEDTDM